MFNDIEKTIGLADNQTIDRKARRAETITSNNTIL
jgi:hypothetical protein